MSKKMVNVIYRLVFSIKIQSYLSAIALLHTYRTRMTRNHS